MNASFSISASPLVFGNTFVVAIYAQSAQNIALQTVATAAPYVDGNNKQIPFQVMFSNLTPQLYLVELWETSNGTASGRLENSFVISISAGNAVTNIRGDIFLKAGTTTGFPAGATIYTDPSLVGWLFRIVKEGYGVLQPNIDYIKDTVNGAVAFSNKFEDGEEAVIQFQPQNATATLRDDVFLTVNTSNGLTSGTSDYSDGTLAGLLYDVFENGFGILQPNKDITINPNGGWSLIGREFQDGQTFVEMFQPNFQSQSSQPSPYNGTLVVTTDTVLTNADCGKAILIMGVGTHLTITLPLLATVNDFQTINFNSCGGNHINVNIVTLQTDGIQRKIPVGEVILAQDEQFRIYKALGNWQVDYISPTVDMVGQIIDTYDPLNEPNCILALGNLVQRADYARLFSKIYYLTSSYVDDSVWSNVSNGKYVNKGFYSMGTDGTDFRLPDLAYTGILQGVNPNNRLAGSFKGQNVGQHDHVMHGKGGIDMGNGILRFLCRLVGNKRYDAGGGTDYFGSKLLNDPPIGIDRTMRTDDNTVSENANFPFNPVYDPENRMANNGIYKMIRI